MYTLEPNEDGLRVVREALEAYLDEFGPRRDRDATYAFSEE